MDDRDGPGSLDRDDPIDLPIDGTLDLHTFRPADVKNLVTDYLEACRSRGILQVRLIHGKGSGTLKRTVESLLARLPEVASFSAADEESGGWGATSVTLRPAADRHRDAGGSSEDR